VRRPDHAPVTGTAGAPASIELAEARGYGLTASDLRGWDPFSAIQIHWARKHGLSADDARRWARAGVGVRDAVRAVRLRMAPDQVRPWRRPASCPGTRWRRRKPG
jgi:hypothetical protein